MCTTECSQFQTYRDILTSDIIHVRFPDMQSIDAYLHVNPSLTDHKGLGMVFNPTPDAVKETLGMFCLIDDDDGAHLK